MADEAPMDDADYETMRARVDAETARREAVAKAARDAALQPLRDLMATDEWEAVRKGVVELSTSTLPIEQRSPIDALASIMTNLPVSLGAA